MNLARENQTGQCSLALGAFMNNDLLSIIDLSQKLGPALFVVLDLLQDSPQRRIGQCTAFPRAHRNMPVRPFLFRRSALFNTPIARIAKGKCFFPMQQLIRYRDIGRIRRRGHQGVRQTRLSIHPDVGFQPEEKWLGLSEQVFPD